MNVALWAAQIFLALLFLVSGVAKGTWSKERLIASGQTGVEPFPLPVLRGTAACEVLAAAGLILPWATGIAPVLTPLAAVGLAIVMCGAISSHVLLLRRNVRQGRGAAREAAAVASTVTLLAVCVFVAVGRF
ncbi:MULTISPECIES: DoxX family protein [Streptomyces]|uniref:DoxX family protein n=1 Tax=Streptomyces lycii TaxID=2654337 RepID=A0ABQ7FS70_9ACTN|nr:MULTISPECIES: DoxX family protein [Streptomyces]KAF4410512.1 DoxX family protein [Streptomyces lycii]PGH49032.1 DoxX family protein [Streptomyces sp. Ru87]